MVALTPAPRTRVVALAVPALAFAGAIAVVVAPHSGREVLTTYAGASDGLRAADLVTGLALLAAGALAWLEPRAQGVGLLAVLAGAAWFGVDWEGWDGGPAVVRSLGAFAAPFVLALVFQLALAFPRAWPERPLARAAVVAVYAVAVFATVGRALFRDPFLDPYCWRNCIDNAFLVDADQGTAQRLTDLWLRSAVVIGILLVVLALGRLVSARPAARRALWPVLAPAALVGAAEAAYAIALVRNPYENPHQSSFSSIFVARSLSLGLLALGLAWTVIATHRRRLIVSRLAADLGDVPPPGKLQEALSAAVGDPTLRVAYWLPRSRRLVGRDGRPVRWPAGGTARSLTSIGRNGEQIAVVEHDRALVDARQFEREIGPAARLAVDNERLQADVLAQLEDLRASRARLVDRADSERQRLERDLHDGAQQRLLALSYDLRVARSAAENDGDPELVALLASASDEAQAALAELRDLAHGIYPAVLAEAGLGPALATLTDVAPLPVVIGLVPDERFGAAIETATYMVVAEVIEDAMRRRATSIAVEMARVGDRLVVTARDDGEMRSSPLVHVADRIGALGGTIEVTPARLRAEIPCA
jgi:signal transduction histidine kinase